MYIQIKDLLAGYQRGIPAISIPDWEMNDDDRIIIVQGSNGSGKSSFLKVLFGGISTQSGQIFVGSVQLNTKSKSNLLKHIGVCLHNGLSYDHLTVDENIRLFGYVFPPASDDFVNSLYHSLDLNSIRDKKAGNLSVGQRKRLDVYLSLQHKPQLVIMDEPTANLDSANVALILAIIRDYAMHKAMQFVIASNNKNESSVLQARVVQIVDGEVFSDVKYTT